MKWKGLSSMKIKSFILFLLSCLLAIPVATNATSNQYEVKKGDTLPQIASVHSTSVEHLVQINGLQSPKLLEGQILLVPTKHEVQPGDSITDIAGKYHSTVENIKRDNHLSSEDLYPGQILDITPKKMNLKDNHILMNLDEFKSWLFNHQFSRKIQLIQQHHTWQPSYRHFRGNNHFQLLNSMRNHHMKTMGWSDIAQNITIFPDGKIAVSRPFDVAPEGTIGPTANKHGIAIENIGNFDQGHDVMTKEQKDAIVTVTALLSLKFNLSPSIDTITYHHWWHYKTKNRVLDDAKDYEVKSCPGTSFFGGNSTASAQKYFYPLVKKKMQEIQRTFQSQ